MKKKKFKEFTKKIFKAITNFSIVLLSTQKIILLINFNFGINNTQMVFLKKFVEKSQL